MKFFLSLLLSLMLSYEAQAQIINFPDPNFKNALVNTKCVDTDGDGTGDADADANNDGEIEYNECIQVTYLFLPSNNISDITGIEWFKNLKGLNLTENKIQVLNLGNLLFLSALQLNKNNIREV